MTMHDRDAVPDDPALRALYRQLPEEQPPLALDEAILAAARREAGNRPRVVPVWQRARVPLAAAASILFSVLVLRQMMKPPAVREGVDTSQYSVGESAPVTSADAVAGETLAPAAPNAARSASQQYDRAAGLVGGTAEQGAAVAMREQRARPAQEALMGAEADANASGSLMDRSQTAALDARVKPSADDANAVEASRVEASEAAARKETVTPLADGPAPPVVQPGQRPTGARADSWPFGLSPTFSPEVACARLTQEARGICSGRTEGGALVLRLTGADGDWPQRLQQALADLGWLPDPAAGAGQFRRNLPDGDLLAWSRPAPEVLELRLLAASR